MIPKEWFNQNVTIIIRLPPRTPVANNWIETGKLREAGRQGVLLETDTEPAFIPWEAIVKITLDPYAQDGENG